MLCVYACTDCKLILSLLSTLLKYLFSQVLSTPYIFKIRLATLSTPRRRIIDGFFICITASTDIIGTDPNLNGPHNNTPKSTTIQRFYPLTQTYDTDT